MKDIVIFGNGQYAKNIFEDFEKPLKTSGNVTKVYKEECVTRSKSKSSFVFLKKDTRYNVKAFVIDRKFIEVDGGLVF